MESDTEDKIVHDMPQEIINGQTVDIQFVEEKDITRARSTKTLNVIIRSVPSDGASSPYGAPVNLLADEPTGKLNDIEILRIIENDEITNRSLDELATIVQDLIAIPRPEQRSAEWLKERETRITASDIASALTIKKEDEINAGLRLFEITKGRLGTCCNPYSSEKCLIKKKCTPSKFWSNEAVRWGQKYEQVITMIYEKRHNEKVHEFGLIPHPTLSFIGASPDGITGSGRMLEIKCPKSRKITGIPPLYYWTQVQTQLEVCDLELCDFLECTIAEYNNEQEYLEDCYYDNEGNVVPGKCSNGLEKGILLEIYHTDSYQDAKYVYPIIGSYTEINDWISNWTKNQSVADMSEWIFRDKRARRVWWKIEKYSCVTIQRNREWFERSLPDLETVWKKILYYRNIGADQIDVDYGTRRYRKSITIITDDYVEPVQKTPYLFLSVSSSDDDGFT